MQAVFSTSLHVKHLMQEYLLFQSLRIQCDELYSPWQADRELPSVLVVDDAVASDGTNEDATEG